MRVVAEVSRLTADRRLKKVVVVATSYSPQKVRLENGGERRRTSNCPVRILAKLHSWNRRKPHFLQRRTTRSRRSGNYGRHQTRRTSKRRYSRVTGTAEIIGFNLSTETESDLSSTWRTNNSPTVGALCRVLCKEETRDALRCRLDQKQTLHPAKLGQEAEAEVEELHYVEEDRRNQ